MRTGVHSWAEAWPSDRNQPLLTIPQPRNRVMFFGGAQAKRQGMALRLKGEDCMWVTISLLRLLLVSVLCLLFV
jgi:hypothetical protein